MALSVCAAPLVWASTSLSISSSFFMTGKLPSPSADFQLPFSNICNLNPRRPLLSVMKDRTYRVACSHVKVEDSIEEEACELVNGAELSIGEGVDSINAYLFTAVKNNNGTGILLLSDIFGFEDTSTRDFAYRVACNGCNVLVPDLFRGDSWERDRPMAFFEQWLTSQKSERVAKDIATAVKWMVDEFVAAGVSKKLGIIVENDPLCPVSALCNIGESTGAGSWVVIYKGRGHGFAHRPSSPEEDGDAEQAFEVMRNCLYNGMLKDPFADNSFAGEGCPSEPLAPADGQQRKTGR
ncbi:hypothetical protein RJ639_017862 [Escallonia herrerae]|uniref:Carboxymethylenebutenolidase homolog n=1 Tax=Escallonia herrerae TaxID=1293975 RepID=A0AA88VDA1_9ASTE|nr:hypothetical protein RJ639_017862 [Escallonia herrerae]